MKEVKKLYNGILNDYSIQRYSLGWVDIIETIEKRYKNPIKKTDESFENSLLTEALKVTKGKLNKQIQMFARELQINVDTLHSNYKEKKGTQKSPFGIGS
jgi:hypothetical protein